MATAGQITNAESLGEAQHRLLRSPDHSDLTVVCKGRIWKCQRAILTQRCKFFKAACGGPFKEAETQTIKLDDDRPDGVNVMLLYLYTLEVPDLSNKDVSPHEFTGEEQCFVLGDKYNLPILKEHGQSQLLQNVRDNLALWSTCSDQIKLNWINWLSRMWRWEQGGSEKIRGGAIEALMKISVSIIEHEAFQKLLKDNEDFNMAFLRALAKKATSK